MKDYPRIRVFINGEAQELKRKESPNIEKSMIRVFRTEEMEIAGRKLPSNARTVTDLKNDRDLYDQLKVQQGELYRKKCKVNNYLVDLPENSPLEEAKKMVDEIMAIKQVYNMNAGIIRYYDQNGRFPEPEEVKEKPKLSEMDKAELMQRRANLRPNISKAKNAIIKYQRNPQKLVQYEQKLASLQAELSQIDERLIHG